MRWAEWVAEENALIDAAGRRRTIRDLDARGLTGTLDDGTAFVSFASNDYLGLNSHPAVVQAAHEALDRWGAGSGSARLIAGARPIHRALEQALAEWKAAESALLFPTGYAANLGVLSTFGGPGVTIFSDELNHASIVDGCRLARADVRTYRHADLDHLAAMLAGAGRSVVVTDAVFSMDGDEAPLTELAALCHEHSALLVVDEAHAVLGPHAELAPAEYLRVGTLSKFLGSSGGFVAGPREFTDLLVNRARSFIFTTASTPADAAAALAAVQVMRSPEGDALRTRLRALIDRVAPGHPSPILPVVLGEETRAMESAAALLDKGLLVPAIRPPSVPAGTSRLRVTLSAAHTDDQVTRLLGALRELGALTHA
jgi:8-amino-7-oxononanoate synthase